MASEIITTGDGSHSLHSSIYNAAYHSHYGAIDESVTIFISGGLHYQFHQKKKTSIKVFEMGFGTGLNAYLSYIFAEHNNATLYYDAIELHPVQKKTYQNLNYTQILDYPEIFKLIHDSEWEVTNQICERFLLKKIKADILNHELMEQYDLIIFDAFAPSCQPKLWEANLHEQLHRHLVPGGCLLTYCAKGDFKRLLKNIGYTLEMLPGPAKKKEITRAIKN